MLAGASNCRSNKFTMLRNIKISISLFALFFIPTIIHAQNWTFEKETDAIKVYSQKVKGSDFKKFKAVAVFNTRIEVLGFILRDIGSGTKWMYDCEKIKVLERYGNDNYKIYMVQGLPWPADNRDVVLNVKTKINYETGVVNVFFNSTDKNKYIDNDYVRMSDLKGGFKLDFIDRQHTRITYTFWAVPGGKLPSDLVNYVSTTIPLETIKDLKKMLSVKIYTQRADASEDKKKDYLPQRTQRVHRGHKERGFPTNRDQHKYFYPGEQKWG